MTIRRSWFAVLAVVLPAGCGGGGPQPVEGKVVWSDGTPAGDLAMSVVVFERPEESISAAGMIHPDGSFKLTTTKPDDGVPAGEYKVTIAEHRPNAKGGEGGSLAPAKLHPKYNDLKTSGLTVAVKKGPNPVTLTVERAPK